MFIVKKLIRHVLRGSGCSRRNQKGIEGIEYVLIAALLIVSTIAAWKALGGGSKAQPEKATTEVPKPAADAMTTGSVK